MSEKITLVPGKRHYIFCADEAGLKILQPLIDAVKEEKISNEIYMVRENEDLEALMEWFNMQKMGCFLYAAAEWKTLKGIKQLAENAGFSDEEAQLIGSGKQQIRVFCCRCQGISVVDKGQQERTCDHCKLVLEVSDHYSPLRDAFLGYVAKL